MWSNRNLLPDWLCFAIQYYEIIVDTKVLFSAQYYYISRCKFLACDKGQIGIDSKPI